jgi:hypothetical protein
MNTKLILLSAFILMAILPLAYASFPYPAPTQKFTFYTQPTPYVNPCSFATNDGYRWTAAADTSPAGGSYFTAKIIQQATTGLISATINKTDDQALPTGFPASGWPIAMQQAFIYNNATNELTWYIFFIGEQQIYITRNVWTYNDGTHHWGTVANTAALTYTTLDANMRVRVLGSQALVMTYSIRAFISHSGDATVIYTANLYYTTVNASEHKLGYLTVFLKPASCRFAYNTAVATTFTLMKDFWAGEDTSNNLWAFSNFDGIMHVDKDNGTAYQLATWACQDWEPRLSNTWQFQLNDDNHAQVNQYALLHYHTANFIIAAGNETVVFEDFQQRTGTHSVGIWKVTEQVDPSTGALIHAETLLVKYDTGATTPRTSRLFPVNLANDSIMTYYVFRWGSTPTFAWVPYYQNTTSDVWNAGTPTAVNNPVGDSYVYPVFVSEWHIWWMPTLTYGGHTVYGYKMCDYKVSYSGQSTDTLDPFDYLHYYYAYVPPITPPPTGNVTGYLIGTLPGYITPPSIPTTPESPDYMFAVIVPVLLLVVPSLLALVIAGRDAMIAVLGILIAIGYAASIIPLWMVFVGALGICFILYDRIKHGGGVGT